MPENIQLAHEHDFLLGPLKISPSTRQITSHHGVEIIEPRIMQVLVCLTKSTGSVVSRDDLISACWNGQIVGDDAINRCISRLRKYAADYDEVPFTIETIPRVGYRLIATDPILLKHRETLLNSIQVSFIRNFQTFRGAGQAIGVLLGSIAVILALDTAFWANHSPKRWVVSGSQPFAAASQLEGQPAISPNGKIIAYTWGTDTFSRRIYLRRFYHAKSIALTPEGKDAESPSWSKDGKRVAYAAFGDGTTCHIYIARIDETRTDDIGHCTNSRRTSISWDRVSGIIYYSDRLRPNGPQNIFSVDPRTTLVKAVTKPSEDIPGDRSPSTSQNGLYLAYIRQLGPTNGMVRVRNLSTGLERAIATIRGVKSLTWTWDSRTILASVSDGIGSEIWAFPIGGDRPYQLYASSQSINRLATGPKGMLAVENETVRQALALGSAEPGHKIEIIDPANGSTTSPAYASDGTLAFISNRSGSNAIWTLMHNSPPQQIYDGGMAQLDRLVWSPDSNKLAFASTERNRLTVIVISRFGKPIAALRTQSIGYGMPTWTPDGTALILADGPRSKAQQVNIAHPWMRVPAAPQGWQGVTIVRSGIYAVRAEADGIWHIKFKKKWRVNAHYPRHRTQQIVFFHDNALIPNFDAKVPRVLVQPISGGPEKFLSYTPKVSADAAIAVDPRSGNIVYVADILRNTNIDLMRLQLRD